MKEEDFNIDEKLISKAEKEYEAEILKTQIDRNESSVNVEAVVKPANDVRYLPKQEPRVETGTIQFGDDWQGLFIRGDNCFAYAFDLQMIIEDSTLDISPLVKIRLLSLLDLLKGIKENRLSV